MGKTIRKSIDGTWLGKIPKWECLFVHRKQKLFLSVYVDDIKMARKKQNLAPMWEKLMKDVDILEATSFLDHVYKECTQRECKPNEKIILDNATRCLNPVFLLEQLRNYQDGTNLARKLQRGHTTWKDMLENAWSGCCELANEKTKQLQKVSHPCLDDHQIKKGRIGK